MKQFFYKSKKVLKEEGIIVFFKKALRYFQNKIKIFLFPFYFLKIKKFRHKNLHQLVDFVFNCSLIKPSQIKEEILELLKILEKKKPKIILEIGTANGGTLFLFSRIAPKNATIISIDLPQGKFGGGYPKWKTLLYKSFTKDNQKIYLLREDSHQLSTLEKVKDILKGQKIDFLFIDGDHSYEGVKKDFEMYSNLVEGGNSLTRYSSSSLYSRLSSRETLEGNKTEIQDKGDNFFFKSNLGRNWSDLHLKDIKIIAFHDIVSGPKENVGGVPEFWREIKENFQHKEIIQNWNQGGFGIGILFK